MPRNSELYQHLPSLSASLSNMSMPTLNALQCSDASAKQATTALYNALQADAAICAGSVEFTFKYQVTSGRNYHRTTPRVSAPADLM